MAGLSTAALTAVAALLSGSFEDTELRVILSSLGFALSSSTAASGAAQRFRRSDALRTLGTGTAALSAVAFVLLLLGLWTGDWGNEGLWRSFGCAAVLAILGSHACLVLGALRPSDSALVRALVVSSVVLGVIDAFASIAPIGGLADEVDEGLAKVIGASLVLLVLTSVLPPILRRLALQDRGPGPRMHAERMDAVERRDALELLTGEVVAIADRIDELNSGPGVRAPEIRREVERLRGLARSFQG